MRAEPRDNTYEVRFNIIYIWLRIDLEQVMRLVSWEMRKCSYKEGIVSKMKK